MPTLPRFQSFHNAAALHLFHGELVNSKGLVAGKDNIRERNFALAVASSYELQADIRTQLSETSLTKQGDTQGGAPKIDEGNGSNGDAVAPFERWLDRKLKTVYGSVLEEPIPQDLIDLLRQKLDGNGQDNTQQG